MAAIVHDMRGIPLWLLRDYLVELGGRAVDDQTVEGDGWRVQLTRLEPFRLGSLEVGQVRMAMEIADGQMDDFLARFRLKTLRAGG